MSTTADPDAGASTTDGPSTTDIAAVADVFFAAIQSGDTDTLISLYHPDARIWHNYDQIEQTVPENLKVLRFLVRTLSDRRYEEVRRIVLPDGFVQQHVLRGSTPRGPLDMPAMMRVWVDNGLVTRIEEYLDPASATILHG